MKIGVDVDLCVVDTGSEWLRWLNAVCGKEISLQDTCDYNLTRYFQESLVRKGVDGFDFWRQPGLYDDLIPIRGSVQVLKKLSNLGHEIVFISALKGNHHKSKVNFIKRFFPFYSAFIGTKEKGYVDVDVMIDDRLDNLYQFPDHVLKVLYHTDYEQSEQLRDDVVIVRDWESVKWVLSGATVNV